MRDPKSYPILVVDDDPDMVALITLDLKREGYITYTCPDVKTAINALKTREFSMAVVDIILDEETTSEEIPNFITHEDSINHAIPIIVTSAHITEQFAENIRQKCGIIKRGIKKPFDKGMFAKNVGEIWDARAEDPLEKLEDLLFTLNDAFNEEKQIVKGQKDVFTEAVNIVKGSNSNEDEDKTTINGDGPGEKETTQMVKGNGSEAEHAEVIQGDGSSITEETTLIAGEKEDLTEENTLIAGEKEDLSEKNTFIQGEKEDLKEPTTIVSSDAQKNEGGAYHIASNSESIKESKTVITGGNSAPENDKDWALKTDGTSIDSDHEDKPAFQTIKGERQDLKEERVESSSKEAAERLANRLNEQNADTAEWEIPGQKKKSSPKSEADQGQAEEQQKASAKIEKSGGQEHTGHDVNQRNKNGETPVMLFAGQGNLEGVKKLVESGASLDAKSKKGLTAMHFAAASGNIQVLDYLIERGLKVTARDSDNRDTLYYAIAKNQIPMVNHLIKKGCRLDTRIEGKTYLMLSSDHNSLELFKTLLVAGLDPNLRDTRGKTVVDYIKKHRQRVFLQFLEAFKKIQSQKKSA